MILTLFVGLLCFTYQAKAQWTVIDPSNLVQNIKSAVQKLDHGDQHGQVAAREYQDL